MRMNAASQSGTVPNSGVRNGSRVCSASSPRDARERVMSPRCARDTEKKIEEDNTHRRHRCRPDRPQAFGIRKSDPAFEVAASPTRRRPSRDIRARERVSYFKDTEALLDKARSDGGDHCGPDVTHLAAATRCAARNFPGNRREEAAFSPNGRGRALKIVDAARAGQRVPMLHRASSPLQSIMQVARDFVAKRRVGQTCCGKRLMALPQAGRYFNVTWRREAGRAVLINAIHD